MVSDDRYNRNNSTAAMMPVIPKEVLLTALETVCYFCTAVGVLLTLMLSSRR